MTVGEEDDEERHSMLAMDMEHGGGKVGTTSGPSGRLPLGTPETRRCGCGLIIYALAAVLLFWAAFPAASGRIWHKASPVSHPSNASAAPPGLVPAPAPDTLSALHPGMAQGPAAVPEPVGPSPAPRSGPALAPESAQSPKGDSGAATAPAVESPLVAPAPAPHQKGKADAWCPLEYPRMSLEEVQTETPYLFGGQPVGCKQCRRGFSENSLDWTQHHACEFWSQNWKPEPWGRLTCARWLQKATKLEWLARGWTAPLQLTPCDLWRFIGPTGKYPGRTLWVIGDSQGFSLYESLKCFLHGFVTDVRESPDDPTEMDPFQGITLAPKLKAAAQRVHPKCKTLGAKGEPAEGRICLMRADEWKDMIKSAALPLLTAVATRRDILVMNTGLHYSPTLEEDLEEMVAWYKGNNATSPFLVWKDTPPQHFDNVVGEYAAGTKPPFTCKPHAGGFVNVTDDHKLVAWYSGEDEILATAAVNVTRGGWRNEVAHRVFQNSGIAMSLTWNETEPLWQHHRSNGAGYECTHYCMPSAPQVWVHGLVQTLRSHVAELNAHFGSEELQDIPPASWPY